MSEIKYLDYEGLEELVSLLDSRRTADNLAVTLALNQINEDIGNINIGNGTLTITRNDESLGTFTANQSSNATIDIDVPESISDFGNDGVQEILNIIKYGLPDVSELTEELKATLEATHNYAKVSQLADYGKSIAYDSGNKKIQLKNGNTVLSEISAADFLVDGMIEDVKIAKGTGANINKDCLIFDFNTDSGITDIEIPIDSIFNANNYYTKDEIDNAGYLTEHQDISGKANASDLSAVATSGDYNDLSNKPTIPDALIQSDWNQTTSTAKDYIKNKPTNVSDFTNDAGYLVASDISGKADSNSLATVATTGSYTDLSNKPNIPTVPVNVSDFNNDAGYLTSSDISGKVDSSDLATVATSGNYNDLTNKPSLFSGSYNDLTNKPDLFSGSYNDLTDKPSIPSGQIQSDWELDDNTAVDYIKNKPTAVSAFTNDAGYLTQHQDISGKANSADLATVATSGDYDDLSNKPTIPVVPTTVSSFTNDAGYLTSADLPDAQVQSDWNLTNDTAKDFIKNKPNLFSGSYNDLTNKPSIPAAQILSDWNLTDNSKLDYIKNKPTKVSDFTNDSNFISGINSNDVTSALGYTPINSTLKGAINGVAELDSTGKIPSSQLPSFVDDVIDLLSVTTAPSTCAKGDKYYNSTSNKIFTATAANTWGTTGEDPESGKIYINTADNKTYRWSGTTMAVIASDLALGETSSTAYRGDRGKTAYDHSQVTSGNPHNVTKSDVGLSNVGNFKAVSTEASQGLSDTEKSNARANIGAGTSSFSGSYTDLSNKPTIPSKVSDLTNDTGFTTNTGTVTQVKIGTTAYNPSSGIVSLPAYPTTLPASDVSSWAKASSKPSYAYSEITGTPTLGTAAAKGVTDNSSNADVTSSDTNLITGRTLYYQLAKKGYTTNTGTITGITMNGSSKGTSGVVNLGTVITDVSGKADKASITAGTAGTSSATSGSSISIPYVKVNAQGIVTGYGTHTHTVDAGGANKVKVGTTNYTQSSGTVTIPNYATYTTADSNVTDIDATLSSQALRKTAQSLTTAEKTQVLTNLGIAGVKNITVSSTEPTASDGNDGDIWFVYNV